MFPDEFSTITQETAISSSVVNSMEMLTLLGAMEIAVSQRLEQHSSATFHAGYCANIGPDPFTV